MTLTEYLDKLKALEGKATEAPWSAYPRAYDEMEIHTKHGGVMFRSTSYHPMREDAQFIAEARSAIPRLIKVVEAQARALEFYASRDVYERPADWRCFKEGGLPTLENCEEVSEVALNAQAEVEALLEGIPRSAPNSET